MKISWPEGLNRELFLRQYWQQKPLLIRGAFVDFDNPLSPDELAGLSLEEDFPSRIIRNINKDQWSVKHGPFNEDTFADLGDKNWSLLVSDIEKHLPEFMQYIEAFRFIPDWRIDDLMISYAPEGASVGPHTDQYDVFLFQAAGSRRWEINTGTEQSEQLIADLDIKILSQFTASDSFTLQQGDMLYLPPGMAHHGISEDMQCMTWSFGFRAPTIASMVADYSHYLAEQIPDHLMYEDKELCLQENPGEITSQSQSRLLSLLREHLVTDERVFSNWVGRFLTESGTGSSWINKNDNGFQQQLEVSQTFSRCSKSRLAYISGNSNCTLFVNGDAYTTKPEIAKFLCAAYNYTSQQLKSFSDDVNNASLLENLHQQNVLIADT